MDGESSGGIMWALLRFEKHIRQRPNQIPIGSAIESAVLSYNVINEGDTGRVYEVLVDWDEDVNYGNFGGDTGVQLMNMVVLLIRQMVHQESLDILFSARLI